MKSNYIDSTKTDSVNIKASTLKTPNNLVQSAKRINHSSSDSKSNPDNLEEYKNSMNGPCLTQNSLQYYSDSFKNTKKTNNELQDLQTTKKILSEMIENSSDQLINEKKLKSTKFSTNQKELKRQLESNFNLFIEGHTSLLNSIAVTSDDKYMISGSYDKTIRIWNHLERRQEAVLTENNGCVNKIILTCDNKYFISCGNSTIII